MSQFDNLKLDKQLCFALYSATNNITRLYRSLLDEYDLTYPQYLVLLVLWEKDGVAIKEVMKRLNLDSGTLSPISNACRLPVWWTKFVLIKMNASCVCY